MDSSRLYILMRPEYPFAYPNSFAFAKVASASMSRIVCRDRIDFYPKIQHLLCAPAVNVLNR
jgi:hypothetical protein